MAFRLVQPMQFIMTVMRPHGQRLHVPRRFPIQDVWMGSVISLDSERRRRREDAKRPREPWSLPRSRDPVMLAIRLCCELDALSKGETRRVKTICKQTNLPRQMVVGAAVYAHVRGWLIYTPLSLL